jgi:hypothetical protein
MSFTEDSIKMAETFIERIHKLIIYRELSEETFSEFPHNIHSNVRAPFEKSVAYNFKERDAFINRTEIEARDETILKGDKVAMPYIFLQKLHGPIDNLNFDLFNINGEDFRVTKIDFQEIVREQTLVYIVGFIESYITSIAKLLESEGFEAANHDFAVGQFEKKYSLLKTRHNIDLEFHHEIITLLDEAFLLRNCIVHNASRYTPNYVTQLKKGEVGNKVEINTIFLEKITYLAFDVIKKLFIEATKKVNYRAPLNPPEELPLEFINGTGKIMSCTPGSNYFADALMENGNCHRKELRAEGYLK